MRNLFGTIVGKLTGAKSIGGVLQVYFRPLDESQSGLSRQVAGFVLDGEGGFVLSTLATLPITTAWRTRPRSYPLQTPAEAMLATGAQDMLLRFGQAMAVLDPGQQNSHWGMFGTALSPDWLRHALSTSPPDKKPLCDFALVESLAKLGGASPLALLDILFHPGPGVPFGTLNSLDVFTGSENWLAEHAEDVGAHHAKLDAPGRAGLAQAIGRFGLVDTYLSLLIDYGLANAKSVRSTAIRGLTAATPQTLLAALTERYGAANPAGRANLIALAVGALGTEAGPLLRRWREGETDKRPLAEIDRALANVTLTQETSPEPADATGQSYAALDGSIISVPPYAPLPPASAIPDAVFDLLNPSIRSYNDMLSRTRAENKGVQYHWSHHHTPITGNDLKAFRKSLETFEPGETRGNRRAGVSQLQWSAAYAKWDAAGLIAFYAHPALTIRHLLAALKQESSQLLPFLAEGYDHMAARALRQRLKEGTDLRAVADFWAQMGGKQPVVEYLEQQWMPSIEHLDPEMVWPHVADSFDVIDEALGLRPRRGQAQFQLANAFDLLGLMPEVPKRYLLALMTIATGSQRTLRQRARALLVGAPNIEQAIEGLLGDGQQDRRAGAAEWLVARDARASVPVLRRALQKEKSDMVRAALISARERLGDDVSDCFDVERLLGEAKAGLAKTSVKGLDWFPFDLLPRLSWRDGEPVAPEIVRWWVVLANKLKQPGGNTLLDLWLERLRPEDAQRLGLFVLRAWIDQDTRMPSDDDANAFALSQIDIQLQQSLQMVKQHPEYAEYWITDRDKLFARLKREKMAQYLGSAADSKGILALASRAGGADAAAAVRAFLKDHGSRVSQDKALLDMLAANPSPAAIQVVLATANRFKARTVQDHAVALIDNVAQRRGWTPDELADRTIPTAGLDEAGEAEIDCGPDRSFRLVLEGVETLALLNAAGQPAKALPAARNDAETPVIAAAKKLVATARKELKQTSGAQLERLYEAMCLERRWPADDWAQHLLRHPIVGRLVRRLVWIGLDDQGARLALFRPLDDGTFSDVTDGAVSLAAIAQVQIAHASLLAADEVAAWRTHMADYEVDPPFAQLEAHLPELTDHAKDETAIGDREGWMIETFKLRGIATKLGFVRSRAEDGGVFTTYERRYNSAGLVALIEFTGSPLPEENLPAALRCLRFAKLRGSGYYGAGPPLKDVPPVLLAESWKALHLIADAGTGHDPDWEKKSAW